MGKITVTNLGKAYKQYPNRWSRLAEWLIPFGKPRHSLKWVLQDIHFTVNPGEAVGIIGINGAGKSTLLKIITGTTMPTTGSIDISGRVSALLELGMGFHPDFTGRQNVYMAGQLLGYSIDEISKLMTKIEDFAEIGEYIDQPVRIYSSGMQMRLAFSVATAHRPDVLVVDEALSVGDAYFQHKSFNLIRKFREEGTTLLLVSHDKSAIQSICDRAILLSNGHVAMEGYPEAVMDYYNAMLADHQNLSVSQTVRSDGKVQTISGTGEATVSSIKLTDVDGNPVEVVDVGQLVRLQIEVDIKAPLDRLVLGYAIKDRLGQVMYGSNTELENKIIENISSEVSIYFDVSLDLILGVGSYSIAVALTSSRNHLENNYEWRDLALTFNIVNLSKKEFSGCVWVRSETFIKKISCKGEILP